MIKYYKMKYRQYILIFACYILSIPTFSNFDPTSCYLDYVDCTTQAEDLYLFPIEAGLFPVSDEGKKKALEKFAKEMRKCANTYFGCT